MGMLLRGALTDSCQATQDMDAPVLDYPLPATHKRLGRR